MRLLNKSPVVTFASIAKITGSTAYAKQLINKLRQRGTIHRLAKGHYTIHDDLNLAVFAYQPGYLGLQSALSMHGLWEQETIPIILTATKARTNIRRVDGANILIRRLDKHHVFGYQLYQEGEWHVPYSDIEKTLIDMITFKERLTPETLHALTRRIDEHKLRDYLQRYEPRTRKQILKTLSRAAKKTPQHLPRSSSRTRLEHA